MRFLKRVEIHTIFPLFEGALETGHISRSSFRNWVVSFDTKFHTSSDVESYFSNYKVIKSLTLFCSCFFKLLLS